MILRAQKEKALEFRNMHRSGDIFVLPNAWDVPSARIFEQAGFAAIGTTSAGIAISLGYPDGQKITRDEMLQVVARIARSVSVPVNADIEAGYGDTTISIADTARGVISAGGIGLNIEDSTKEAEKRLYDIGTQAKKITVSLYDIGTQAKKITIIRKVADLLDVPLVINARTDALLVPKGDKTARLKEAIARGNAYREAGADCVFPVGAIDAQTISEIVRNVGCPVNILATNDVPPVTELKRLGVRRVSVGSGPWLRESRQSFGRVAPTKAFSMAHRRLSKPTS